MNSMQSRQTTALPSLIAACCLMVTATARAEEPLQLPNLTVTTASRKTEPVDDTFASVSVITREDIRRSGAVDLLELLRLQTGVDIVRTGPAGAQTSLFLRGGNSDHVLVLIDGVRVASAHTGTYAWELLPVAQIERIEIVRGPRAAWYGSDAIGGVIQVFTRQQDDVSLRLTGGSYGTVEGEAGFGWAGDGRSFSLNAAWRDTRGFSAQNSGGFGYDPDNDGHSSKSAGISGALPGGPGEWSWRVLASDSETEFDQGVSDAQQTLAALAWDGPVNGDWSMRLQAGWMDDQLESDYGFFASNFTSQRLDFGWQNWLGLANGQLGVGLDLVRESGRSDGSYDVQRDNRAAYAVWEAGLGQVDAQLGGRFDDNSQFGNAWTWQAAAAMPAGFLGQVGVQLGTAFRAPDLGEQFSPGFGGFYAGNPDLRPEQSRSAEINLRREFERHLALTLVAWRTEIDQLIAFSGERYQAVNIDQASIRGLEAELGVDRGDWKLRANLTLQETEDGSTGQSLLRRPDRKGSLSLDRLFAGGHWLGFDWFASGTRLDVGGEELPGYALFSARGGWRFKDGMTLEVRLENLLDKRYEPADGYNAAGRSVFLSFDWRP